MPSHSLVRPGFPETHLSCFACTGSGLDNCVKVRPINEAQMQIQPAKGPFKHISKRDNVGNSY